MYGVNFMLTLILVLNAVISFFNARIAGKVWAESQAIGGNIKIMAWCAAIQSAIGFSYIYITILMYIAYSLHAISSSTLYFMHSLAYLFLVIPLLGTGLYITINSWIEASREQSLSNMGLAGWNTFATIYNTYGAIQTIGPAFETAKQGLSDMFSDNDGEENDEDDEESLAIILVILAIGLGILTTKIIIDLYTASLPVPIAVQRKFEG